MNSAVTPGRVVVCGKKSRPVLYEVGAEQQAVAVGHRAVEVEQEARSLLRPEVADRAPEEHDETAAVCRDPVDVEAEVAHDRMHLECGVVGGERRRCVEQRLVAHVERDVLLESSGLAESVEKDPGLLAGSRAELDQHLRARTFSDLTRERLEQAALGSGQVVLGEPGDLVEQCAAPVVVEPDGRQPFLLCL